MDHVGRQLSLCHLGREWSFFFYRNRLNNTGIEQPRKRTQLSHLSEYNSCCLPIQVMTTGPLPANPDGSTLEGRAQRIGRPFGGGGTERHRQEDPDQGVYRKGPSNLWWNSPAAYSADCQRFRRLTHNCECMCEGGLEVEVLQAPDKLDLDWEDNNFRLIQYVRPPPPLTWTRWTTSFGHTLRKLPTWPPTTPKPAWSPPSAEYLPSSSRCLGKSMLPVPDPYRGADWGWKRLHWIVVSSTT